MVPTKEKASNKKNKVQDHPIFFKGSTIKSVIPKQASGIGSVKRQPKKAA